MNVHSLNTANKIKNNILSTADESKESIKELMDSNANYVDAAIKTNKKVANSIKEKLEQQDIVDSITEILQKTFGASVQLSEENIKNIVDIYTKQMELNTDFHTKLIDEIKQLSKPQYHKKILHLIDHNFGESQQLAINNIKEILQFYSKHTQLALDYNKTVENIVDNQMQTIFKFQNMGISVFTNWVSDWWKQSETK